MTRPPFWSVLVTGLLFAAATAGTAHAQSEGPLVRVAEARLNLVERATLAAERTGVLEQVAVQEGLLIEEGSLIARLRDQVIRAQLAVADKHLQNDVDLRFAKKAAELSTLEFSKSLKVNEGAAGTITEMELRRQRLASEKALLQLEQAQLQLDIAKLQRQETYAMLASYTVTAPWSGYVVKVHKRRGEAVREGEPIAEIADLSQLRAEGYVTLADSFRLRIGAPVQFRLDIAGTDLNVEEETFQGELVFVEPKVDPITQKVRVWAKISNSQGLLKDGMQGSLYIASRQ